MTIAFVALGIQYSSLAPDMGACPLGSSGVLSRHIDSGYSYLTLPLISLGIH
jgi:hypothetical protein